MPWSCSMNLGSTKTRLSCHGEGSTVGLVDITKALIRRLWKEYAMVSRTSPSLQPRDASRDSCGTAECRGDGSLLPHLDLDQGKVRDLILE